MLVLSRRYKQTITLQTSDGVIRLTVADLRRDRVRIGIEAPKSVQVTRDDAKKGPANGTR